MSTPSLPPTWRAQLVSFCFFNARFEGHLLKIFFIHCLIISLLVELHIMPSLKVPCWPLLNTKNDNASKTKDIPKGKHHYSLFWKAFKISSNYFSFCTRWALINIKFSKLHKDIQTFLEHFSLNCSWPVTTVCQMEKDIRMVEELIDSWGEN